MPVGRHIDREGKIVMLAFFTVPVNRAVFPVTTNEVILFVVNNRPAAGSLQVNMPLSLFRFPGPRSTWTEKLTWSPCSRPIGIIKIVGTCHRTVLKRRLRRDGLPM